MRWPLISKYHAAPGFCVTRGLAAHQKCELCFQIPKFGILSGHLIGQFLNLSGQMGDPLFQGDVLFHAA